MPSATDRSFTCVSCEGRILGSVEIHVGLPFCCAGCVAGGPCICSYDPAPRPALEAAPRAGAVAVTRAGAEDGADARAAAAPRVEVLV